MAIENDVFDVDLVDSVDQSTVERLDVGYPIIQWHRGSPALKKLGLVMDYAGGWFIAEAMAPTDLTAYGWTKESWTHDNGDETEGYYTRELTVSVIRERKRWEVWDGTNRRNFAWKDFDKAKAVGRPTGRTHVLVLIQGLEDFGPFVITLKGMAGVHFQGSRQVKGVLPQFDSVVVRAANDAVRAAGKKGLMPRRAFWLTVGASRDAKDAPLFVEVGQGNDKSSMVVPQALGLPEKPEQVKLSDYFVGRELLPRTTEIYQEAESWAVAWDEIIPGSTDQAQESDAAPAQNGAQAVETVTENVAEELGL